MRQQNSPKFVRFIEYNNTRKFIMINKELVTSIQMENGWDNCIRIKSGGDSNLVKADIEDVIRELS